MTPVPQPRPEPLAVRPEGIPSDLKSRARWVLWRYEWRDGPGGGAWTKVPRRVDGRGRASATDAATWSTYELTIAAYRADQSVDGIGFVLGDGIVGVDHDAAYHNGTLNPQATAWGRLGAYRELSPSGHGVHDLLMGTLPGDPARRGLGRRKGPLEVYAGDRFFTITGQTLPGSASTLPEASQALAELYREWLTVEDRPTPIRAPASPPTPDDEDILRRARSARNGSRFESLWAGTTTGHGEDDSVADLALLSLLTFWTQDPGQLDRLFRQSGLYREKWERADYRDRTIARALNRSETYQGPARVLSMPDRRDQAGQDDQSESAGANAETPEPATSTDHKKGPKSQATQVVELAHGAGLELWHTPPGDAHVTIRVAEHREHHAIGSKPFKDWLARQYWVAFGKSIGSQALQDAINTLAGEARFEGPEHDLSPRITHRDGGVWIDLGTAEWSAVRIDQSGYAVVASDDVPVKFRRTRSIMPLPEPCGGGTIDELRGLFRFEDDAWLQTIGWLIGAFQADGARAHLELIGRQGSGKSTFVRFLVALVDPCEVPARSLPKDEESLLLGLQGRSVLAMDNLSSLTPEMADAFCRVSTGGGISRRQLYSDSDELLFRGQLPLVWSGIAPVTSDRPDLLDRTLTVTIEPIEESQRRSERALMAAFEEMKPRLLGALYDVVVTALQRRDGLEMENLPRLADFTLWVEAAAPGVGWTVGDFTEALGASRQVAEAMAIEASPIGPLIMRLAEERGSWRGSATELLAVFRDMADDETRKQRRFPKTANYVSNYVRRLQPALASNGVYVGLDRSNAGSKIFIDKSTQMPLRPSRADHGDDDRMVF